MNGRENRTETTLSLRVLIIDDHPLFREALISAIAKSFPDAECREARSIDDAVTCLNENSSYDLALLDLNIPGVAGFDGLLSIRKSYPQLPVLVVTSLEDQQIARNVLRFGAAGYVPKSVGRETLGVAIQTVVDGSVYMPTSLELDSQDEQDALIDRIASLTPQQFRVLQMLREGMLNKQIAFELNVGATTVKAHVSEILRKLGVYSRTQAVIEVSKLDQSMFSEAFDPEVRQGSGTD